MTAEARSQPARTNQGLGTAVFLASESFFFLTLILAFFYLRAEADPARLTGGDVLDTARSAIFTAFLIASSGTYLLAERSHQRQNRGGLRLWLAVTLLFGVLFLAGQAWEYYDAWGDGLTIESDVFGTQFYTLTGIHFLHVSAGAVMLAILLGFALGGRAHEPGAGAMQPIGYYWHFVDVVWIILFTVVYLVGA
ncbi:MAG: cytochrome c oxidase subunit 3 [Dehalococcoidia bacterium]